MAQFFTDHPLAIPNPEHYRYAVHCCAFKWDIGTHPDEAIALFAHKGMATAYGVKMWPGTFEVVDLLAHETQEGVDA